MEEKCLNCSRMCKQLDANDMPVKYYFENLKPNQIIVLVESVFKKHPCSHLVIDQISLSQGNQLAILILPESDAQADDSFITLIAQSEIDAAGLTELWFRYGVDDQLCDYPLILEELQTMINQSLQMLIENDLLLAAKARSSSLTTS